MADEPKPPPPQDPGTPAPPVTPPDVKKGANAKTPREIQLEKKISALEDDVSGLKGWRDEVNALMADMGLGAKKPAVLEPPALPGIAKKKGFMDELSEDLGLEV